MKKYLWNYELNYAGSYEQKNEKTFEMTRNSDKMKSVLYDYSKWEENSLKITLKIFLRANFPFDFHDSSSRCL
jgi:hypothetical protein